MAEEQVAPTPGTPEYDAAMAARYDAHQASVAALASGQAPKEEAAPEAQKAARPDNVPEEFWDAEKGSIKTDELLKALAEKAKPVEPPKGDEKKPDDQVKPEDQQKAAEQALADKGLQIADFSKEFAEKGALSEDSYSALEKAGIPRDMVDAYIAGQQALGAQRDAKGYEAAGGQEQFQRMAEWAGANMTQAEKIAFNEACKGTDEQMLLAVQGLRSRYESEFGTEPGLLGGQGASQATPGYASRAEMTAEMNQRDPRGRRLYDIDPAHRAKVQAKIGASSFF